MLAYVFWHWKQLEVAAQEYENRQRAFHAALNAKPPQNFVQSFSTAISQAPWAASGGEAYEDWYLVQDFAALGALNEAAVSASRSAPHDAAASVAANGVAGIYGLRAGALLSRPQYAYWFQKPRGMTYGDLDVQITPLVEQSHGALWIRQMTLGPANEFCLRSESAITFPSGFAPLTLPLRSIWPEWVEKKLTI